MALEIDQRVYAVYGLTGEAPKLRGYKVKGWRIIRDESLPYMLIAEQHHAQVVSLAVLWNE